MNTNEHKCTHYLVIAHKKTKKLRKKEKYQNYSHNMQTICKNIAHKMHQKYTKNSHKIHQKPQTHPKCPKIHTTCTHYEQEMYTKCTLKLH